MSNSIAKYVLLTLFVIVTFSFSSISMARNSGSTDDNGGITETFDGRDMIIYAPQHLPAAGARSLVIVLHGGMGSAEGIASKSTETSLNMNDVANRGGFVVAYLNGTRVANLFGSSRKGWNAGGCCGLPAKSNVDDVGYIRGAVQHLITEYGIDPRRVYSIGHSNGALMTHRLMCETNLLAAGVAVSGTLDSSITSCPASRGKGILDIHGANDRNVPVEGGKGKGLSGAVFNSEANTQHVYVNAGANFVLDIVPDGEHAIDGLNDIIQRNEGITLQEKAARFFGLLTN